MTQLAELADTLSDGEKPSYGMFYAYWMAKLYGYDLGKKGYFRDREQVDWSTALIKSKRIAHQMLRVESLRKNLSEGFDLQNPIELFERRDGVVRKFWDVTRKQFETDPIQFRR